jgi:hypothetical protein
MTAEVSPSWATTLADLAIILFMITAADLSNAEMARSAARPSRAEVAMAEPVALYRPDASAPPLGNWLAEQSDDPRQQLTIVVHYRTGEAGRMATEGLRLVSQAKEAGRDARLIAEPAERSEVAAVLAYDANSEAVARKLHD